MKLIVNGHEEHWNDGADVATIVRRLGQDPSRPGLAVARNGDVIPRRQWADIHLADGDRVEVVRAVQGG